MVENLHPLLSSCEVSEFNGWTSSEVRELPLSSTIPTMADVGIYELNFKSSGLFVIPEDYFEKILLLMRKCQGEMQVKMNQSGRSAEW